MYKHFLALIIALSCAQARAKDWRSRFDKNKQYDSLTKAEEVYKEVYDDFSDILEAYYKLESCLTVEREHYISKIIEQVIWHVNNNKLKLYGNMLSRWWRNAGKANNSEPLKQFVDTFAYDAIGHLEKHYKKNSAYSDSINVADLINSLKVISNVVKSSGQYKIDELSNQLSEAQNQIQSLKAQLDSLIAKNKALQDKQNT